MDRSRFIKLFNYKHWADSATLHAISAIHDDAYQQKRHLMLRLMNHIYVVDMIFRANLSGTPHGYSALNTPETPSVETLEKQMHACFQWYIGYLSTMEENDFTQQIRFKFVDGVSGEMTACDMLEHVLLHGTYHRGAIGWLISECNATPPKDVLTVFLRDHHH
ncbi:diguanylate cyclase [Erwinia sp. OLTSP20]|uniref:DinB family protein n=1 Tax=unclassified Erwinia TaxID=2622719 RepID=UPI000C19312E|nr:MULTISPECIES: DinB family protein [unclassified Erwinia]PIJ50858.1 diguanylate cyclase [Erwinia sp. OAMSP11]PIJ73244.1 diguanylate cyclase [Erwinia sp. OLSSP12]PIJ82258.1 diguanylate cyclase [Erwinia sp. OLCASP19]PIJ85410.1 diguanylate cyclase [Erwinia sp. OLMTSP26]PIJ87107.1 diguanylate cyclase [Erwinia sp. OLMDSP33]